MRKRIVKAERINLDLLYHVTPASPDIDSDSDEFEEDIYEEYDQVEEYRNPEKKRLIPDGETAFFSAIKNGEDW
jgi:hypothetical protein